MFTDNGMASDGGAARRGCYFADMAGVSQTPVAKRARSVMSQWAAVEVRGLMVAADRLRQLEKSWKEQNETLKGRRNVFKGDTRW